MVLVSSKDLYLNGFKVKSIDGKYFINHHVCGESLPCKPSFFTKIVKVEGMLQKEFATLLYGKGINHIHL
jgi:hypothetical protein